MYEEILDQMQELLKDEIKNFSGDFGKLEQSVMAMMMSFGKGPVGWLVRERQAKSKSIADQKTGRTLLPVKV